MRYFCVLFISVFLISPFHLLAKGDKKNKLPKTEAELIGKIVNCLQYQDTVTYATLFPEFDTVWKQVEAYQDTTPEGQQSISHIRSHPEKVQQFDPYYNHDIVANFYNVLRQGENLEIHWNQIVLLRYELSKENLTRDLVGYEKIAPVRFRGYVFIKDMLTRRVFCFTVTEMQQIQGYWYGGQVINIFESATVDGYTERLMAEVRRKKHLKEAGISEEADDSARKSNIKVNEDDEDQAPHSKQEIVQRKLFRGTFDNSIPIVLYIQYIKGDCPEGICSWAAIYKFGDDDDYIKLDVSKTDDGSWVFTENPPLGSMELTLKTGVFTGNWASTDNQTGYTVKLMQSDLSTKLLKKLDGIIENDQFAKGIRQNKKKKEDDGSNYGDN